MTTPSEDVLALTQGRFRLLHRGLQPAIPAAAAREAFGREVRGADRR